MSSHKELSLSQSWLQRCLARSIYLLCTLPGLLVLWCYFRVRVTGRKHLPRKHQPGAILISNYSLRLDPLVIAYALFPRRIAHSTTERNMRLPFVGWFIQTMGAFAVSGRHSVQDMRKAMATKITNGGLVHFFPEGRLEIDNQKLQRFRHGAFYLAHQLNVPVIPITTSVCAGYFLGKARSWLPKKVFVDIGQPVYPMHISAGDKAVHKYASRMAVEMQQHMQDIVNRRVATQDELVANTSLQWGDTKGVE